MFENLRTITMLISLEKLKGLYVILLKRRGMSLNLKN